MKIAFVLSRHDLFSSHVEIRFSSVSEAEQCVANLSNFREGVVVRRITYDYSKGTHYSHSVEEGEEVIRACHFPSPSNPGPVTLTVSQSSHDY